MKSGVCESETIAAIRGQADIRHLQGTQACDPQGRIAASVEEQAATTNEVTRIVTESAEGVKQINENIAQVSEAAGNTGRDALKAQDSAKILGEIAQELNSFIAKIEV